MQKFLDIFLNVMIILMIIICVYFALDKFVLNKSEVKEKENFESEVQNFNGSYVTDYYEVNLSHYIVEKYVIALKNNDISSANNYLVEDIKVTEEKLSSISSSVESDINILEVKENSNKTEILITYSTKANREDRNTMLCKIDRENQTFLICYDSILNSL